MGSIIEFPSNEAFKNFLLTDWPRSSNYKPCFNPAFWLDVPDEWKNLWN